MAANQNETIKNLTHTLFEQAGYIATTWAVAGISKLCANLKNAASELGTPLETPAYISWILYGAACLLTIHHFNVILNIHEAYPDGVPELLYDYWRLPSDQPMAPQTNEQASNNQPASIRQDAAGSLTSVSQRR